MRACGTGAFCCLGTNDSCSCTPDSPAYFTLDPVKLHQSSETSSSSTSSSTTSSSSTIADATEESVTSEGTSAAASATSAGSAVSSSPNENDSGSSLAVGLGAGLGIGIPLTALLLAGIWFWRRKRGQKQQTYNPRHHQTPDTPGPGTVSAVYTEIPKQDWTKQDLAASRQGLPRYELPAETYPASPEMGTGREAAELPSTRH